MAKKAQNNVRDYLHSRQGCLPCFHSRMTGPDKWRCALGHSVVTGRACGAFEAARGRQVP